MTLKYYFNNSTRKRLSTKAFQQNVLRLFVSAFTILHRASHRTQCCSRNHETSIAAILWTQQDTGVVPNNPGMRMATAEIFSPRAACLRGQSVPPPFSALGRTLWNWSLVQCVGIYLLPWLDTVVTFSSGEQALSYFLLSRRTNGDHESLYEHITSQLSKNESATARAYASPYRTPDGLQSDGMRDTDGALSIVFSGCTYALMPILCNSN